MNICLIGSSLTSLALAKNLINKKIKVFIYYKNYKLNKFNSRTIGISRNNLNFFNNEIIASSSTGVSRKIHLSVLVGEEAPPLSSQVFRVGAHEFSGVANTAQDKLDKGNGPSGYWKLTGEAFDPHASPNTQIENSNLLSQSTCSWFLVSIWLVNLDHFFRKLYNLLVLVNPSLGV